MLFPPFHPSRHVLMTQRTAIGDPRRLARVAGLLLHMVLQLLHRDGFLAAGTLARLVRVLAL
jgi:hypothetical protein